ncbi:hypothetical protein ACT3UJ_04930 [Halomonas sp. 86]|uniref:hypothetical protein n=1 Tax=unclassified Halomonas TaxID=2609666 RepID=UPI004033FFFB
MIDTRRLYRSFSADQFALYLAEVDDGPRTVEEALNGNWIGARQAQAILDAVVLDARTGHLPVDDEDPANWVSYDLGHRASISFDTTFRRESLRQWLDGAGQPVPEWLKPIGDAQETVTPDRSHQPSNHDDELAALRQEVAELRAKVEKLETSVPLHPGHLMAKAIEAQHKYWQDPEKRPKAEGIVRDLRSQHPELSEAKAKAIEAVACPIER